MMHDKNVEESGFDEPSWRGLITGLDAPVYACDAGGRISFFNRAAAELWGRTPSIGRELWCGAWRLYRTDGTLLPPDQSPMALALRERRPVRGEEIIIERPDGSRRHVQSRPDPVFNAEGAFAGVVNLLLDVTDSQDANAARSRLAAIVQFSDDAIVSKDLNGIIISWNRGAQRVFGYTAEEVIGRSITVLIPPGYLDEEPGVLSRIRRGESIEHYETVRRRKDGSLIDISLTVSPIIDQQGRIIGASKIARDITERKRAERDLAEADRRKDEFLATLAHELRNPLAPLKSSVEMLRMDGYERPVSRQLVEMMDRQVHHLVRLVDDLMEVSRITRGAIELKRRTLSLDTVLRDALEASRPLLETGGHTVSVIAPEQPLRVDGDSTRLVQVLANLLNNAAKFTPPHGSIRVQLEQEQEFAVLRVIDNGVGIPAEIQAKVFNMFTQAASPLGGVPSGLGIGLALARKLVMMHGGDLRVRSEGQGKGSEFIVRLPLAGPASPVVSTLPPSSPQESLKQRRILVADDNSDAADCMALMLRTLGHMVQTAYDGQSALRSAVEFHPDLAVLDIGMPKMNGYEVAKELRRQQWGQSIELVALTGWGQESDRRRSLEAGFDHHLVKPVDFDALEKLLLSRAGASAS